MALAHKTIQNFLLRVMAGVLLGAPVTAVQASDFPSKPVKLIVSFTPGAGPDLVARSISVVLSRRWNTPVIVENKTGADGAIASDFVAKAPADGHTLYLATMGNIALLPAMTERLPYDARKAYSGVSFIAANPFAILVRDDFPARTMAELVALSKRKQMNYGGAGTLGPLIGGLVEKRTGADLQYIAYKGAQPAITDLLGGQIDMVVADLPSVMPFNSKGKGRLLAITTAVRSPIAPEVPTISESGYPDFDISTWYALVAPAGTPKSIVRKLNTDLSDALSSPEVVKQFQTLGMSPKASTPEAMDSLIQREIDRWDSVVKQKR